ncbi:MAG: discoidin domain-containing protein [Victivallales bacterium]|nr:discoidin domain-containing protein [Victivallales bacterium]
MWQTGLHCSLVGASGIGMGRDVRGSVVHAFLTWLVVGLVTASMAGELPAKLVAAGAFKDRFSGPGKAVDGKVETEFVFHWANKGGWLVLDLGAGQVLEAVEITNAQKDRVFWLTEVYVGADGVHWRPLLGRKTNLSMWRPNETTRVTLADAVGRYVKLAFSGGGPRGGIAEVKFIGRPNRPERHLLMWATDLERDYLAKMDYFEKDLGITDLWLDSVESAFPQTNRNSGFKPWVESGALATLRQRNIRYWLGEHESFGHLVNTPEALHDDLAWGTTLRRMREIYAEARKLGFRGLVFDAEDYDGVPKAVKERYKDQADYVSGWTFNDEFGYAGGYYQRGLQVGKAIYGVWPGATLIQMYEARMYAGRKNSWDGNHWWLKGIHDGGVEIWLATEKTYGAGKQEMKSPKALVHLQHWFVDMRSFAGRVHAAYPFVTRVLPGFHPWNCRLGIGNYLPKYLDEQLSVCQQLFRGCWIYNEGNKHGGDPRLTLDPEKLGKHGVTAEDYLKVFRDHPVR